MLVNTVSRSLATGSTVRRSRISIDTEEHEKRPYIQDTPNSRDLEMVFLPTSFRTATFVAATLLSHTIPALSIRSSARKSPAAFAFLSSTRDYHLRSNHNQLKMSTSAEGSTAKRVLVPIADDSEEIETACITDTLARFGAEVTVASVKPDGELVCKMSRGIKFMADVTIDEAAAEEWDLIALPGGMPGAEHLRDCNALIEILKKQKDAKKQYAAVCASPAVVLAPKDLLPDGAATCYPAPPFRQVIKSAVDDDVVVTDNVTTSQGPGTSLKFALQLGEQLYGKEKADEIAAQMLVSR